MSEPPRDSRDLLREALGRTAECPPIEALAAAGSDAAVQRHLETCAPCRAELALFQEFESAQPTGTEATDLAWMNAELNRRRTTPKPSLMDQIREWFTLPRLALAAVALLVLIVAGIYLPDPNSTRLPDGRETSAWRSGQFTAITPAGDLDRAPSRFQWESVEGAASYHVRLLEVDGTEIWSGDTNRTSVEIPNSTAAKMIAGRAFQWDVMARDNAGRQIASTNLQSFHMAVTSH